MIKERLVFYAKSNWKIPEHILFHRDGVSESQYGMVKVNELRLINEGCRKAREELAVAGNKQNLPQITLLVVGKRHHTRFFNLNPPRPPPKPKTANPPSGLVVDTEVVDPTCANFYLQSHDSPLGIVRPAHYVVIENKSAYSMVALQELVGHLVRRQRHQCLWSQTMNLCYTGSRATKGLSQCVPARYADLLCDQLRNYMKPELGKNRRADSKPRDLATYNQDNQTWNATSNTGTPRRTTIAALPWHSGMDDCMFFIWSHILLDLFGLAWRSC